MSPKLLIAAALVAVASAGCARAPGDPPLTHTANVDVGGAVLYAGNPDERLSGVAVTLTDIDGDTRSAITGSGGLWTITNVRPGVYVETYEAPGYEPFSATFGIEAFGEDDVKNAFIPRPDVSLAETRLTATVSGPFSAVLRDGDAPLDGFNGATFLYSEASGGDIVVTFSRLLLPDDADVRATDGGDTVDADRTDTATQTVFTLPGAELVSQLDADSDGLTFLFLEIDVEGLTPIHEEIEGMSALLRYNATP
jgi:hypothetical protein